MNRRIPLYFFLFIAFVSRSQCPQIYNYLGTLSSKPYFINCTGGSYAMNIQSNSSWGSYTVNWGDGGSSTGASYSSMGLIPHTYTATIDTFVVTLIIPANSCTMQGIVVMEKPVNASIQIPTLGITQACAPKTLTFANSSTDVSASTTFTWNFGDGTPEVSYSYTNQGQNVAHLYQKNTVNCQTQVTLRAQNYCSFGNPTIANFNPIQIYDVDNAAITPDRMVRCWPDNIFTFSNTTSRNCLSQGNTFQRQEWWKTGNYWGYGHDSIISWSPWPPSTPRSFAFPSVGSYSIMLRDSNLCGIDTAIINVTIVNAPVAGVTIPTISICQNVPVTFTNSSSPGYSYRWNFGAGAGFQNLGSGNKTFTYTSPGTYVVRVVALIPGAGGACQDTASAIVNVNASPVADFSLTPAASCNSASVTFSDLSSAAVSWNWAFGNGNTSTLQTPPLQSFTTPAVYITTLQVTASTGCSSVKTGSLIVRPNPLPAFTQFTACAFSASQFTNGSTVTGTNPVTSYTWDFGDATVLSNSVTPVHTYTAPGTYTVRLSAATAFCTDSVRGVITVNVRPTPGFVITPTTGCPVFSPTFSNSSQNAASYFWRAGTVQGYTSAATAPSFTYANATQSLVNYSVTLIALSSGGCADSIVHVLSVKPKPVAAFTVNSSTGCSPLVTTFSNTSTGTGTSAWLFGDGGTSASANPVHTYTNVSLFTQTVTAQLLVTNSFNCNDTVRHNITVYAEALPAFSITPSRGCSPLFVTLPSVPGIATYTWTHGDGTPSVTTLAGHGYTYTNSGSSSALFTVSLTAQTSNGCLGSATNTVEVFPSPVASFTASPASGCAPLAVSLANAGTGYVSSSWSFDNGLASAQHTTSVTYTNAPGDPQRIYSIKLVVVSRDGCRDSVSRTVTVFARPRAVFTADTPACSPKVMTFSNASAGAATYQWAFSEGGVSSAASPTRMYVNNSAFDRIFSVKLNALNADNCGDSASMSFVIHKKPQFFIASFPDSGCSPLSVRFSQIADAVESRWSFDGVGFGAHEGFSNKFENGNPVTQTISVQVIGKDQFGCSDTATKKLKVYPRPNALFSADPLNVFVPTQPTTFRNLSTGASTYSWSFGDETTSTAQHPSHTYQKAGEYQVVLIARSNRGCTDTFALPEKVIGVEETTIRIPNAFTPNTSGSPGVRYDPNDLSNDIFHPVVHGTEKYQLSIFTRWGELIYETKNPDEGWDGYYKGQLCTQDIYIWKITATFLDGKSFTRTGDVLLMK